MSGAGLRGVYNILATPFHADFTVDEGSLRRLVEVTWLPELTV
jgi:dihydrodipicolinate synthase/N-acetylneuraminate lyase